MSYAKLVAAIQQATKERGPTLDLVSMRSLCDALDAARLPYHTTVTIHTHNIPWGAIKSDSAALSLINAIREIIGYHEVFVCNCDRRYFDEAPDRCPDCGHPRDRMTSFMEYGHPEDE